MEDLLFSKIAGFSMWPLCKPGDKLLVKRIPLSELKTADIIVYNTNDQLVSHRLLRKFKGNGKYRLYLRGDCSLSRGEFVSEEQFFGKAIAIIKNERIVNLTGKKQRLINCVLMIISPLFSLGIKLFISFRNARTKRSKI
jgi:signal peptidase I